MATSESILQQGWSLHQRGQFDAALSFYQHAITLNPDCYDAHLLIGNLLAQENKSAEALSHFRKAIEIDSNSSVAQMNAGLASANLGLFVEAKKYFEGVLALEPQNPIGLMNLARVESELGNYKNAFELFEKLEQRFPKEPQIWLNHASALYKALDHETALIKIQECLELLPKDPTALDCKALILRALGRHNLAKTCLERALSIDKNNPVILAHLGAIEKELQRYESAEAHLKASLTLDPKNTDTLINLGLALAGQEKHLDAIAAYQLALKISPNIPAALNNLGTSFSKIEQYDKAIEVIKIALELQPENSVALANLAKCYNRNGLYQHAIESSQSSINLDPLYPDAYIEMGNAHSAIGESVRALEILQSGVNLMPSDPKLLNNLGLKETDLGFYKNALENFSLAEKLDPQYAVPKYNKALVQIKLFNFEAGWKGFNYRWEVPNFDSTRKHFNLPKWRGQTCKGLYIWKEQGIGDQIQLLTLLPSALSLAQNIIVQIDERLIPLMQNSYPAVTFVGNIDDNVVKEYDFQIPMGDLPSVFIHDLQDLKTITHKPLTPDPNRKKEILDRIGSTIKRRIGISWRSSNNINASTKSLTLHQITQAINPSEEIINLQYGDVETEILKLRDDLGNPSTVNNAHGINLYDDISGLAALIDCCDAVLTSSNVTAHIAGALAKPTIVMTPFAKAKHWYWWHNDKSGRNLWYPTVHVLSQEEDLKWEPPLRRAKELLPELLNS